MRWAAPSKLQRHSGDRVKTDQRAAMHLARLLGLDEVTSVTVPSIDREASRDLVRAREDCRGDLMWARHRVPKLLLRHGLVYCGGQAWTGRHDAWLRGQHLPTSAARLAFDRDYDAVLTLAARRHRLDEAIEAMAADSEFTPIVHRLGGLRGISTLAEMGVSRARPLPNGWPGSELTAQHACWTVRAAHGPALTEPIRRQRRGTVSWSGTPCLG